MTIEIRDRTSKTYIVLGMHQGGTSFICKALHDQPEVDMGIGTNNRTYEDRDFVKLNDAILAGAGGNWFSPPAHGAVKSKEPGVRGKVAQMFVSKRKPFWGWKDPRTTLTWDVYSPHLDDDTYLVCVIRKPEKVAESLQRRSNHNPKQADKELAKTYYRKIVEIIQEFAEL